MDYQQNLRANRVRIAPGERHRLATWGIVVHVTLRLWLYMQDYSARARWVGLSTRKRGLDRKKIKKIWKENWALS